jgi:hypothetical protein
VPAVRDPLRRPPVGAAVAAVLALPGAVMVLVFGNAALSLSAVRDGSGGASWLVLLITFGWVVALLVGAGRLLTGRSWLGLAVSGALLALLGVLNATSGGLGGANTGLIATAFLAGGGAAVGASLPGVRAWVSRRRRERLFPGSTQRTPSGS